MSSIPILRFAICLQLILPATAPILCAQSTLIPLTIGRDMVFDHSGKYLYISTSVGKVKRYNLSTGQLSAIANLGGSLNGMDIAPDDSFLLVAQDATGVSQGTFQKVDLSTRAVTNINYTREFDENGAWDVAIGSNGLALVTTQSGFGTPLRQIDLATNAISIRSDAPGSGFGGNIQIHRSADGTLMYFLASGGSIFTYSAITDTFGPGAQTETSFDFASAAVNRNGSRLGTRFFTSAASLDTAADFSFVHSFNGLDSGIAFDAVKNILYGVNSSTDQLVPYNTNTFVEKVGFDIGEDVSPGAEPFGVGTLVASHDGRHLALITPSGIRVFVVPSSLTPAPTPAPSFINRRDLVFDHSGSYAYISTSTGLVERYNLSTAELETLYNLGGSLNGIDIAPDDSFLLVAQDSTGVLQGAFHKVNLGTGAITNIGYSRSFGETGAWDVVIGSNGLALVTTQYGGSGWTPLRQINLATNAVSVRDDAPGSAGGGMVTQNTQIHRSADGTRIYFLESNISSGPVFTYSATTDTFGPSAETNAFLDIASAAVNRNGSLLATRLYNTPVSLDTAPDFNFVHSFNGLDSGVAFDAVKDVIYGVNSSTDRIVAYDTNTFTKKFRLAIGQNVEPSAMQFDTGTLIASQDGHYLALFVPSGVRFLAVPQP